MDIFAIGGDEPTGTVSWEQSAKEHDNKRVIKMILETAQLLCTTPHLKGSHCVQRKCRPPMVFRETADTFSN